MKSFSTCLIKSLLGGFLISAVFTACSDDLVGNTTDIQGKDEGKPAYLSMVFSTNGSVESRAGGNYNNGDGDGNAEDSGHSTVGLEAEYNVNTVLVIALPQGDTQKGFANLYAPSEVVIPSDEKSKSNKLFYVYNDKVTNTSSSTEAPIELAVGTYKLLVVVNPPVGNDGLLPTGFTSLTELADIKKLYEKAINEAYVPGTEENKQIYTGLYLNGSLRNGGVMMSNKVEPADIKLTSENTPENPYSAEVEVERAISKITYRTVNEGEKYPITIETNVEASWVSGVVIGKDEDGNPNYTIYEKLYWADDLNGKRVGISYTETTNEDGTTTTAIDKAFDVTDETRELTEAQAGTGKAGIYHVCKELNFVTDDSEGCKVNSVYDPKASLEFVYDAATAQVKKLNVVIKGYALVNLAKSVNYVRHTVGYSETSGLPWGTVTQRYLWTPNWKEKNEAVFNDSFSADAWFYNTLANVSEESKTMTIGDNGNFNNNNTEPVYFKPMSSLVDNSSTDVDGDPHDDYADEELSETYKETGLTMGYCLENSVDIDHQLHGLTTGLAFVATVEYEDGTEVEALYRYNGYTYLTVQDIVKAYGTAHFGETLPTEDMTKVELAEYDIVKYEKNVCYYYTTEIKHFDNGTVDPGYMEFAIMRNNIYSMAIKNIRGVGDPYIDPTPDTPNEKGKSALDIEVKIVPWKVRFNDIEF